MIYVAGEYEGVALCFIGLCGGRGEKRRHVCREAFTLWRFEPSKLFARQSKADFKAVIRERDECMAVYKYSAVFLEFN